MSQRSEHSSQSGHGGLMLLAGLGLGALIMYLSDPQAGRRRRARLVDQYEHTSRKVHRGADVVIRDARNRAHGFVATAKRYARDPRSWSHPGRHREGRLELLQEHWSPAWRSLAGAIGAGLTMAGWIRGGLGGLAMGTVGGSLVARATANRDLKSLVGAGTHGRGIVVQKSIHIEAPVEDVYGHWKIENFPQWMSHVRRVTPLADQRHHWVVDGPADVPVEWESEITEAVDNERMAWRSIPGSSIDNAGSVRFTPENGGTRVQVTICYMPPAGVIGHAVAKALGSDPKSRMDDDLQSFKSMIETGQAAHDAALRQASPGEGPRLGA